MLTYLPFHSIIFYYFNTIFSSEVEPSLALSHDNFLASNISTSTTTNTRPGSPPEYKMFNNNESRDQEVKTAVRPSPDSGLAISEAMSNSGSPGAGAGPPGIPHPPPLQPQGSPIPGSNLVVRPQPARSPYEWMRKGPSNTMQNRPKEGQRCLLLVVHASGKRKKMSLMK